MFRRVGNALTIRAVWAGGQLATVERGQQGRFVEAQTGSAGRGEFGIVQEVVSQAGVEFEAAVPGNVLLSVILPVRVQLRGEQGAFHRLILGADGGDVDAFFCSGDDTANAGSGPTCPEEARGMVVGQSFRAAGKAQGRLEKEAVSVEQAAFVQNTLSRGGVGETESALQGMSHPSVQLLHGFLRRMEDGHAVADLSNTNRQDQASDCREVGGPCLLDDLGNGVGGSSHPFDD